MTDIMHGILDKTPRWPYTASAMSPELLIPAPTLVNRLKVARAERNLSQDQLAGLAGVTRQTISSIETGQYVPSALLAFVLAARLGKRVDELFILVGDQAS
jgi:putative transcriptional regulator